MNKYQEVELKFPLINKEQVIREIKALGFQNTVKDETQNDSYFMPCHRNFLDNDIVSEWLRIRETKGKCTLNFKQWLPIGAKIQNKCNEYETGVENAYVLRQIFNLLDFKEIIVVNKTRNSWVYENVEISIDHVDGLGEFIELEAMERVEESQIRSVHDHFVQILKLIKAEIGERDHRGYPYLLLNKSMGVSK